LKKIKIALILMAAFLIGLAGCSSSKSEDAKINTSSKSTMDSAGRSDKGASAFSKEKLQNETGKTVTIAMPSQMVIYEANLRLKVKGFEKTVQFLENNVKKYGGYISESTVTKESDGLSGSIKIRVPQKYFQDFLHDAEGEAAEVLQRNITGQDVTEEYVDLESRLKSKRVVEERLTSFLKTAAKTEDLLKISSDLAAVQEEIETIEGKMKYLENLTALSTVNITLYEDKVIVPDLDKGKLNTWERTKKQFMESTNFLLSAVSGLVVFFIGNLPVLIILALAALIAFVLIKKVKNRE
jgi:hypothetical protein